MKKIRHIWFYLTKPMYRAWVDISTQQEVLDRNMMLIEDNWKLMSKPVLLYASSSPLINKETFNASEIRLTTIKKDKVKIEKE